MKGLKLFRGKKRKSLWLGLAAALLVQGIDAPAAQPDDPQESDYDMVIRQDPNTDMDSALPPDVVVNQPEWVPKSDQFPVAAPAKHLQWLVNAGITPQLAYTAESAANLVGGVKQGSAYSAQLLMGFDFDMDRLFGMTGSIIHFYITQRHGKNLAETSIGNNTSVQEIYGTQNTHLAEFTINQKFFNNRLELVAGRMAGNAGAFFSSSFYCNFQSNSVCGNPTMIFKDSNFTHWAASEWGGYFKVWFTDKIWFEGGAFESNPQRELITDHGFGWGTKHATGAMAPFELAYQTNFSNDYLPRSYRIGGWYDGGDYKDPVLDAYGRYAVLSGEPYATLNGRGGIFFRFDQMVWRPDPQSQRGLTIFGVAMKNISGRVAENHFFDLGFLWAGTFKGRDKDILGFMISDQRMSGLTLDNIRAARVSAGGSPHLPRDEFMMELTYGAQVTPAFRVSPNIQYILHPDQIAEPFRTKNIPNVFIVGLKFSLDMMTHFN
ncbi:MAG: carbohydrate porin, partial [Zymomonas mobilis subsp. pomaceae]